MASGGSRYFQASTIRRQDPDAVNRGMQVGQEVGKLLGGLAGAIKGAQKDAIANRLMDQQAISEQPGAGQTQDLGTLPGDGGSTNVDASQSPTRNLPTQDLGQLPADQTFTNPATGNIEPLQGQSDPDADLAQAVAAARLGSGPTVGSAAPAPSTPPVTTTTTHAAPPSTGGDFTLNPSDYSGGGQKVGSLVHTGGVQELDLQKEILAQQMQKQELASSKARAADLFAEQQGTGRYALEAAQKRATLAHTQAEVAALKSKPGDKNPPAVNIDSEPVIDQNQLNNHINKIYGNGAAEGIAATLNEPPTVIDPDTKMTVPNPNAPVVTGTTVTVGPKNKRVTMPLGEAKIYVRQANVLRLKQGLPAYPVPGEDPTIGATPDKPYQATTNLDVYSRAPGTWIRLPNGKIAQVPNRRQ
jgi:hypothetical protein